VHAFGVFLAKLDAWQRRTLPAALTYAVVKKFGDDGLGQYAIGLGWYGFLAIYPLLLIIITIFGFIGASSLGTSIVSTLHQFPVIGSQFNPAHGSRELHGNIAGLVIGLIGLTYGAQGVTQTAQRAMAQVWNVPRIKLPGFFPRLGRSMAALCIIGGTFVVNAAVATYATGGSRFIVLRLLVILGMLVLNALCFFASFRTLTPGQVTTPSLVPGAILGGVGFTALITVGSSLVVHQLRHSTSTYGQFGAVIGLVGFLLILARVSLYAAELNPVLSRRLWPRSLVNDNPSEADDRVLQGLAEQTQSRAGQTIRVGFTEDGPQETGAV
jgi:uncharacterized BrkB/YihY/UPF0761 family membrane protein